MKLFRFEALGLLPKNKQEFDGLQWDGSTYREIQLGLDDLHRLTEKAEAFDLLYSDLYKTLLVVFRKSTRENPTYLIPDARRAGPLWRKFNSHNGR